MDVLLLGGTVFLGRVTALQAVAAGHRVTVLNRGRSGPTPDGAEGVVGDRTVPGDLAALAGRRFDLVVDTSGYVPDELRPALDALVDAAGHYVFISSVSAYPGWPATRGYQDAGVFDADPDATRDTVPPDVPDWQHYGWLKAGCERAVLRAFGPQRATVLRAGAIVGPHDSAVGRLPWWTDRFARGGEVLVPGRPGDPIALLDVRDLADAALLAVPGTFECGGPATRDTWGAFVEALSAGTDATPVWVDADWLAAQDVEAWTEVPLWTGDDAGSGTWAHDDADARAAGVRWRPLAQTVAATRAWQAALPQPWTPTDRTPGLAPATERRLLDEWRRTAGT